MVFAAATANRWLLAFIVGAVVVLATGYVVRRRTGVSTAATGPRSVRRRAGALLSLGGLVGLAFAPSAGDLTLVVALGAPVVAGMALLVDAAALPSRATLALVAVAAAGAVAAGAELGPTGVAAIDLVGGGIFVVAVATAMDRVGRTEGALPVLGTVAAAGVVAVAGFADHGGLAAVLAGTGGACAAFLAFNLRPAALVPGRAGGLAVGFAIAVGTLALPATGAPWRELATPIIALGLFLLDAVFVVTSRLRRRQRLLGRHGDDLMARLVARGWRRSTSVAFVALAQLTLSTIAVFVARGVASPAIAAAVPVAVLLVVTVVAARARIERVAVVGFPRWAWGAAGALVVLLVLAVVPLALEARSVADSMRDGRDAAKRGLELTRDGDTEGGEAAFRAAAIAFRAADDTLGSPLLAGGRAVPFLGANVDAARTLAATGRTLAEAGESLTAASDPESLEVVDGRLPIEKLVELTPELDEAAGTLRDARRRVADVRRSPYLAEPVRDAVDELYPELARADREAQRAVLAARLAPAIFGVDGERRYLLVVQNNSEARATGGFIGAYGLIEARDGRLDVGPVTRTREWNEAIRARPEVTYDAPDDYRARYAQYHPETTLQNVNFSPDFPAVAEVLMSLAPQAGLPPVDGVLSVDPQGLAALLELTGPVEIESWPEPIDSENVVDVTLRDAYAAFPDTPERADFLGEVAEAAVTKATAGRLGKPNEIAEVLGRAAHRGHINLAFARPEEEQLARRLDVAGEMTPVASDAVAVTTSNARANKLDYYLQRSVEYRATVTPTSDVARATVDATLAATLVNHAPPEGLPAEVSGDTTTESTPPGTTRQLVSMYSPLDFLGETLDGTPIAAESTTELGRNVFSRFVTIAPQSSRTLAAELEGTVDLRNGWYSVRVRAQPTVTPDRLVVSIEVPVGWRVDRAPGMTRVNERSVAVDGTQEETTTYRVHVVRDEANATLWQRLRAGG